MVTLANERTHFISIVISLFAPRQKLDVIGITRMKWLFVATMQRFAMKFLTVKLSVKKSLSGVTTRV